MQKRTGRGSRTNRAGWEGRAGRAPGLPFLLPRQDGGVTDISGALADAGPSEQDIPRARSVTRMRAAMADSPLHDLGVSTPLVPPLFQSSVYTLPDLDALDRIMNAEEPGFVYARDAHPNARHLAARLASL